MDLCSRVNNKILIKGLSVSSSPEKCIELGAICKIGRFCTLAGNITAITANHNYNYAALQVGFLKKVSGKSYPYPQQYGVTIEHDVWIGENVLILPGVKINSGAIIAAGSVVTKDVEPYTIYGGIPAKKIKNRFNSQIAELLLKLEWWYKPWDWLVSHKEIFSLDLNSDVEHSIRILKKALKDEPIKK